MRKVHEIRYIFFSGWKVKEFFYLVELNTRTKFQPHTFHRRGAEHGERRNCECFMDFEEC